MPSQTGAVFIKRVKLLLVEPSGLAHGKLAGWEQQRQSMIGSQDLETRAESGGQGCRESKTGQQGFVAGRMGGLPSLGHCRSMNDNVKVYKDLYYGLH